MELIRDLEEKFLNLDMKLNSNAKQELVDIIYKKDLEKIEHLFNAKKRRYKNGLNQCREEILKQNIQIRDEQLQQVNEFIQSSRQINLSELERLHNSINQNYTAFAKGLSSVFESIMFRTKLSNPLKFAQLFKYVDLMSVEEQVCLAKVKHPYIDYWFVHVLPSNRIFIHSFEAENMFVLNKSGDLIHFKEIETDNDYDTVHVNGTNVIAYNRDNRIVDVYNFKLELVHSIKLERKYCDDFNLNNYEIALSTSVNFYQFVIACYNYKTTNLKKKEISINKAQLKNILDLGMKVANYTFQLVDLTDQFLFIKVHGSCKARSAYHMCLLNRHDNNNLFKYFKSQYGRWLIYNNQICLISREFFEIYQTNGLVKREPIKILSKFRDVYSTSNGKYIFNLNFNADNFSLEFELY